MAVSCKDCLHNHLRNSNKRSKNPVEYIERAWIYGMMNNITIPTFWKK
ncbi:hypothetical protein CHK_3019 [Christensenella hongkongensis]|uniref:Uncharacterized protein n=1 Tax=Christensenella hongkongensis TaxID=270498 RepID=A0A0M2NEP0_9FIRM|nr:hypothetical protein CHK_3019 [Christensenella hongkongensis]